MFLGDRALYPLCCGTCVINPRFFAHYLDLHRYIDAQNFAPREFPHPFVQLRQVHRAKAADAGQHAIGPPQLQVGAPHLGPPAAGRNATLQHFGRGESQGDGFIRQHLFQPGGRCEKYLEFGIHVVP